ncbi:hypothetical protein OUZ56_001668 [Daphnia magna]|uniref:Uncharacterized protein n=1 Tax=Daphnia magna TaxID=35525 RepID=A0ABR0A3D2_9CRUS|nr:hypothetical protein OUZ56_001668 [Daphnia magna]
MVQYQMTYMEQGIRRNVTSHSIITVAMFPLKFNKYCAFGVSENVVPLGHTITMCVVEDEQHNKLFCKWIILAARQSCRTASTPDDSHEQQQNNILKQQNKGAVNDSRIAFHLVAFHQLGL